MGNAYEIFNPKHNPISRNYFELKDQTPRYLSVSLILHACLFLAAAVITIPLIEKTQVETIEFEITDLGGSNALANLPAPVAQALPSANPLKQEDTVVVAKKSLPPPAPRSKPSTPATKSSAQQKMLTTRQASPVVVPETLDDIAAPELEKISVKDSAQYNGEDLDSDMNQIDRQNKKALHGVLQDLHHQTEDAENEQNQMVASLNEETQQEMQRIAAINQARRQSDAQKIAGAKAAESAAVAAAAARKAQADAEARGATAARRSAGSDSGLPNGIRSLSELRQKPGNPIPQYESSERLQRQQGDVSFVAYINREGIPSQFRLIHSSGYRNLDAKTLKALKQWRFFPGQEGWVELPFKWDLKGGPQEMPALLRRHASK